MPLTALFQTGKSLDRIFWTIFAGPEYNPAFDILIGMSKSLVTQKSLPATSNQISGEKSFEENGKTLLNFF